MLARTPLRALRQAFTLVACVAIIFVGVTYPAYMPLPQCGSAYTVAVYVLPGALDPRRNRINAFHYLMLQLYYPLMTRQDEGAPLCSEFLDMTRTRAVTKQFNQFNFCLRPQARFTDGSFIEAADLERSLRDTHAAHQQLSDLTEVAVQGDCVYVTLPASDPQYFDKFSHVGSTVLKRGTEHALLPTGLGPYEVERWSHERMSLRYRGAGRVAFETAEFIKVRDLDEALRRHVCDFNLLYWEANRQERLATWPSINHEVMRTYSLIIAMSDASLRHQIIAGLDRAAFVRDALAFNLIPTAGYLPNGVPGSRVTFEPAPPQAMGRWAHRPVVPYLNPQPGRSAALRQFFANANLHLPVRVEVQEVSWSELRQAIAARQPVLYTVGIDSASSQVDQLDETWVFFEPFFSDARCIDERLDLVDRYVDRALHESSRSLKARYYEKAHRALLDSGYVLPLGQLPSTLYYAPCVGRVEFADPIAGYPRIDLISRQN